MKRLKHLGLLAVMAVAAAIPVGAGPVYAEEAIGEKRSDPVVWADSRSGNVVSLGEMMDGLSNYQVVVFGEFHDSQPIHDGELEVLRELYSRHGSTLALSLEMFERDVQPVMDAYLAGTISEAEFLAASRPWPQYETAYKPMVEFAKKEGIPVLTGNIPRRMAAAYAKTKSLDGIAEADRVYLPKAHKSGSEAYREKFAAVMAAMRGTEGAMNVPPAMVQPMFMAQCLKDDAMAESIADYLAVHDDAVVYHVVGNFHSEGRLGAVEKLHDLAPDVDIAVIDSVHYDPEKESIDDAVKTNGSGGDYLALETAHRAR